MELFKREGVVKGTTSPRELKGEEDRRVTSGVCWHSHLGRNRLNGWPRANPKWQWIKR